MKVQIEKLQNGMRKIYKKQDFGLVVIFFIIFVCLSLLSNRFATLKNIFTILNQSPFITIMAIGMTLVIATGGIDLSVGAIMSITGIIAGDLIIGGVNVYLAIAIALAAGFIIGLINGLIITMLKITDFIVTLSTMTIIQGILRVHTAGLSIFGLDSPDFIWLGQGKIFDISIPFIISMIVLVIFLIVTYKTAFGKYVISIGSNQEAARLVGINIAKTKTIVYALCGLLSALSSILITAKVSTAMPNLGDDYAMNVIAAAVIGGASLSGGKARIFGAFIGSLMMTMIRNGLNVMLVDSSWHQVVIGIIILVAVGFDVFNNARQKMVKHTSN
ncbi:MAG: ABC transporter permease [Eubacteriales bacterium]|nr:ABC transporter permease [Eubacteriales bacterium]